MVELKNMLQKKEELIVNLQMNKITRNQVMDSDDDDNVTMVVEPPDIENDDDGNPMSDFQIGC